MFDAHWSIRDLGKRGWLSRTKMKFRRKVAEILHWFGIPTWTPLKNGRACIICWKTEKD